ncbi:FAST kinase domain-containing protein 4 [Euwallacea fornicatus]|uniref:FAST kinase domain-containing protein 4 n=1 Tax=Euwallacea fornicatus TaxID=995702 RepID=UPI0033902E47
MLNFYRNIFQHSKSLKRLPPLRSFVSATIAEAKSVNNATNPEEEKDKTSSTTPPKSNCMVKTVFASIQLQDKDDQINTPFTDKKLETATTVDELLSISEGNGVSRRHALKVVSILSAWTSSDKIALKEFERDPRFLRLCKILTKGSIGSKTARTTPSPPLKSDDLTTVLSVTADDEAAKLVSSITLSQMIKVLSTLSIKRRRSTLLLQTLAFNIAGSSEQMNIKECADLLYSISCLNFFDENLFAKSANNVISALQGTNITKSAVIGSIITSVGLLKYKNPDLLDAISDWVVKNHTICRPQDIFSLFMTLAVLNYIPSNSKHMFKVLLPQLTPAEAGRPGIWLEIVWSLVLLNQATCEQLKSVLHEEFINKLKEQKGLNTSAILKLLNIDGAAHYLIQNYKGPKIATDQYIRKTSFPMGKEKELMVNSVIDALKSLIPDSYFRSRVNTGLGFYIDAECALDKSCNPLPLKSTGNAEIIKVAMLTYDYHDICKGKSDLTGINVFCQRLLTAMGYRVVSIPFTDFRVTDKIVNKVQYLENQLKQAVSRQ